MQNPMKKIKTDIFDKVNYYLKQSNRYKSLVGNAAAIPASLQKEFNSSVDEVYADILSFEKENSSDYSRLEKFKKIFIKRYRRHFLQGKFISWSYKKPFGYPGDFKIIDDIYRNEPSTSGYERLWDNYFQQLAISGATRERKSDFKKFLVDFIKENRNSDIRIMNLASGPAREIKEIMDGGSNIDTESVTFDCCDFDAKAINYASELLGNFPNINFLEKNAVRLALKKDIKKEIPYSYDIIYSTGLFDYLQDKIALRLIANLKKLLKPRGKLIIASVRDRYSNPSVCWMEWVADWNLIYRNENEFKKIFLDAGFLPEDIGVVLQKSRVMQYCIANNSKG